MDGIIEAIQSWFQTLGFPKEIIAFIISMLPIVELRGGLPIASLMGIPWGLAILICMVGNLLPIPFILWLIIPIFKWMKNTRLFRPLVEKLEAKSLSKSDKIKKYEFWGLLIFVGIPLPGTGAWTGALIAALLDIDFKKAILAIVLGVLLAGGIMSVISYVIPWIISLF